MLHFKLKIRQKSFLLAGSARTRWGSLQRYPGPSWIKGKGREGWEEKEEKEGRGREGRGGLAPIINSGYGPDISEYRSSGSGFLRAPSSDHCYLYCTLPTLRR